MKTLTEKHSLFLNGLLVCIAIAVAYGKLANAFIFILIIYGIASYKDNNIKIFNYKSLLILSAPLVLELLFFWNNDSLSLGLKSIEKYTSVLVFFLFIVGNHSKIDFEKVLKYFSVLSVIVVLILLIRFLIISPDVERYLNGIDLHESGYVFCQSFGVHAPALNMHLSFAGLISLYYATQYFRQIDLKYAFVYSLVFAINFLLVLVINTRLALFNLIFCSLVIIFSSFKKQSLFKLGIFSFFFFILITTLSVVYVKKNPYMLDKYSTVTFGHLDKIGRLDDIEDPHIHVFNGIVTRLSIWKSALALGFEKPLIGHGSSDANRELHNYYQRTNQKFLYEHKFNTHNQFLNYFIKFGFIGVLILFLYFGYILRLSIQYKDVLLFSFFFVFLISNIFDDFLNRFDGIAFSAFWLAFFYSRKPI